MMRSGEQGASSTLLTPRQQREMAAVFAAELQKLDSDLPYDEICGQFASLLLCAIPLVLFAGIAKLDRRPPVLSIDLPQPTVPAPPLLESPRAPIQIAQAQTPTPAAAGLPATTPKFDDVSVKPCESGDGAGRSGRGGGQARGIPPSPAGEIYIHCLSVREMLNITVNSGGVQLLNDPGWVSDPQRIQGGPPGSRPTSGPSTPKPPIPSPANGRFFHRRRSQRLSEG